MIKSIHGFVRRRETERSFIQPQALFDAVLPLLELQAKQLGVRLVMQMEARLPDVWCDATLIEQVIINLARNGMQAMDYSTIPDGRRKLILLAKTSQRDATHDAQTVEIQITDQGLGMTHAVAQRLFTPFFTTKQEGMGLGLSLCRTVIEQHGGEDRKSVV